MNLSETRELNNDRLNYLAAAESIKTAARNQQDMNREWLRAKTESARELRQTVISKTTDGIFLITTEDPVFGKLTTSRLTNQPLRAVICWASETATKILKLVTSGKEACVAFRDYPDMRQFERALDRLGVCLSISTRRRKEAVSLLLEFLYHSAPRQELLFGHGWNKCSNGEWRYADADAEVLLSHVAPRFY